MYNPFRLRAPSLASHIIKVYKGVFVLTLPQRLKTPKGKYVFDLTVNPMRRLSKLIWEYRYHGGFVEPLRLR